jgi:hypothetical protein
VCSALSNFDEDHQRPPAGTPRRVGEYLQRSAGEEKTKKFKYTPLTSPRLYPLCLLLAPGAPACEPEAPETPACTPATPACESGVPKTPACDPKRVVLRGARQRQALRSFWHGPRMPAVGKKLAVLCACFFIASSSAWDSSESATSVPSEAMFTTTIQQVQVRADPGENRKDQGQNKCRDHFVSGYFDMGAYSQARQKSHQDHVEHTMRWVMFLTGYGCRFTLYCLGRENESEYGCGDFSEQIPVDTKLFRIQRFSLNDAMLALWGVGMEQTRNELRTVLERMSIDPQLEDATSSDMLKHPLDAMQWYLMTTNAKFSILHHAASHVEGPCSSGSCLVWVDAGYETLPSHIQHVESESRQHLKLALRRADTAVLSCTSASPEAWPSEDDTVFLKRGRVKVASTLMIFDARWLRDVFFPGYCNLFQRLFEDGKSTTDQGMLTLMAQKFLEIVLLSPFDHRVAQRMLLEGNMPCNYPSCCEHRYSCKDTQCKHLTSRMRPEVQTTSSSTADMITNEVIPEHATVIMSTAINYGLAEFVKFVIPLRNVYHGDVVVFVNAGMSQELAMFCSQYHIKTRKLPASSEWQQDGMAGETLQGEDPFHLTVRRHIGYSQVCAEERYRWCLATDFRDVFFQAHPFKLMPKGVDLVLSQEYASTQIKGCIKDSWWIKSCWGDHVLLELGKQTPICAGTIFGTPRGLEALVEAIMLEMRKTLIEGCANTDQRTLNYLYFSGKLNVPTLVQPRGEGIVNTVGKLMTGTPDGLGCTICPYLDSSGLVSNTDGSISAVVHQYDRFPELKSFLEFLIECLEQVGVGIPAPPWLAFYNTAIQLTVEQISSVIEKVEVSSHLLVFGVGKDTKVWLNAGNKDGRTLFLEDSAEWRDLVALEVSPQFPELDVRLVDYDCNMTEAFTIYMGHEDKLMESFPPYLHGTLWDVILVDAPRGYNDHRNPGRMKSIYWASQLIKPGGHVFVHDIPREIEDQFSRVYLEEKLGRTRSTIHDLAYFAPKTRDGAQKDLQVVPRHEVYVEPLLSSALALPEVQEARRDALTVQGRNDPPVADASLGLNLTTLVLEEFFNVHGERCWKSLYKLKKYIPNNAIVFDIGSNLGMFTYNLLEIRPNSTVHLFEPIKAYYDFSQNKLNHSSTNVIFNNYGLSNAIEELFIYKDTPQNTNSSW